MVLISIQWYLKPKICQGILDWEFYCEVSLSVYVVLFITSDVAI